MLNEFFQVNWVLVDAIIIVFLFLLLISVRIFKSTHRWRLRFSNEALEYLSLPKSYDIGTGHFIFIKQCNLTRNSSRYKDYQENPLIMIVRTKLKTHLTKIITEGLSSYGFNIINLKLKIKFKSPNNDKNGVLEGEINSLISLVISYFNLEGLIPNPRYILLNCSKSFVPHKKILSAPNEIGHILVNPRINKLNNVNLKETFHNLPQHPHLFYIFSTRNFFFLKNLDLKHFIYEFDENNKDKANLITLEKSTKRFKYYETIFLGTIIDIIENKLLRS
jgi:hypothetical protein